MNWTPDQVAAAVGILAAAVATNAVILARAYVQVRDIVEGLNRSGVSVRGAKGQASAVQFNRLAGSGASSNAPSLLALDPVSQRRGATVVDQSATTGPWDCGPACVVSEIESIHGCWSADELLRLRYFGVVDNRLTTAADLVGMLQANNIPAHPRVSTADTAKQEMVRNWQVGRSSFALGEWVSPGVGHWMRFRGDDGFAEFMDPWPGGARRVSWQEFAAKFWGEYVHVDAASPSVSVA